MLVPMRRLPLPLLTCLLLLACGGDDRVGGESSETACSDGTDNDGDGRVDCLDDSCLATVACTDGRVDGSVDVDAGPPRDSGPPAQCDDPIDIVFVIDVSTSMDDEIAAIRTGVDNIFAATDALTDNFRFGLVVFVDDVAVVGNCRGFGTVEELRAELNRWETFTQSNDQPGGSLIGNGDCAENSLDALYEAAVSCPWRQGSLRLAVHVTDDTFEERPASLSSVPVQRSYAETVSALVQNEVRVGSFSAPGAGEECGAGSSANVGRGFHEAYRGMPSIPMATGGRAWSIRDVRAGSLDMADAINDFAAAEYCTLF